MGKGARREAVSGLRIESLRRAALIAVAAVAVMALGACGGESEVEEAGPAATGQETATGEASGEITLSTFGGAYSDAWREAVVEPFSEETGIAVQFDDSPPGESLAKLRAQTEAGRVLWDVVEFTAADATAAAEAGLLLEIPEDLRQRLEPVLLPGYVQPYGVAAASGANQVLACNAEVAERCPQTAADFWNVEEFPGPRTMWRDGFLENMVTALSADGVPNDEIFPIDIERALRKLDEIRPHVSVWFTSGDQQQQVLRDEEVHYALGWDGRLLNLQKEGMDLEISYETASSTPNFHTVPKDAPNAEAALRFIEWYSTHPEQQGAWVTQTGYSTSNPEFVEFIDRDLADSLWTSPEHLDQVLVITELPDNLEEIKAGWYEWLEG